MNLAWELATATKKDGPRVCLIDLDTIARLPVAYELGDALRSWCNPEPEDSPQARFSLAHYEAAIAGYAETAGRLFDKPTRSAVASATLTIAIELAARFAADALNEAYFSWDRYRFASAGEHNLARARAQLGLAESLSAASAEMNRLVMT